MRIILKVLSFMFICLFLISCTTVEKEKKTIEFNEDVIEVKVENTYIFELNQDVTITSNDETVASVEGNVLTALKAGSTTIVITLNEDTTVTKEVTITVIGKIEYTIAYDLDGGNCEEINSFLEGEKVTLPTPTKTGYTFVGWYEGDTKVTEVIDKDYNLTAKWEILTFTISFYDDENNLYESKTYNYNEDIVAYDSPTKESTDEYDYTFTGWDQEFSKATEDLEIHASFEATRFYQVSFYNGNNVITTQRVQSEEKIEELDLSSMNEEIYQYEVAGYYQDQEYQSTFQKQTKITDDTAIYVKLTIRPTATSCNRMKISILGDSISTFYAEGSELNSYYTGNDEFYFPKYSATVKTYTATWWGKLLAATNTSLGINNSLSGSTCHNFGSETGTGAMNYNRINTLGENGTPHIIIVFIGTNDNVNGFTTTVFKNAYDKMLDRINEKYPRAYVFCMNLGYSEYEGYSYKETTRISYNEIIAEVAKEHKAVVIDIASVQTIETYKSILGDYLHPSLTGMQTIATKAENTINNWFTNGIQYN